MMKLRDILEPRFDRSATLHDETDFDIDRKDGPSTVLKIGATNRV